MAHLVTQKRQRTFQKARCLSFHLLRRLPKQTLLLSKRSNSSYQYKEDDEADETKKWKAQKALKLKNVAKLE